MNTIKYPLSFFSRAVSFDVFACPRLFISWIEQMSSPFFNVNGLADLLVICFKATNFTCSPLRLPRPSPALPMFVSSMQSNNHSSLQVPTLLLYFVLDRQDQLFYGA